MLPGLLLALFHVLGGDCAKVPLGTNDGRVSWENSATGLDTLSSSNQILHEGNSAHHESVTAEPSSSNPTFSFPDKHYDSVDTSERGSSRGSLPDEGGEEGNFNDVRTPKGKKHSSSNSPDISPEINVKGTLHGSEQEVSAIAQSRNRKVIVYRNSQHSFQDIDEAGYHYNHMKGDTEMRFRPRNQPHHDVSKEADYFENTLQDFKFINNSLFSMFLLFNVLVGTMAYLFIKTMTLE
ncbi:hypothetical protein PCANC_24310 [Puccinia coronata f. sp. avenae]|uniref:Uncharacterized protein n=1 Tax=Puccinia coronata f. sp. avenae TaxID=200324 RepID=A0A2N5UR02_9BASI|nr:hypothetical protein PCANC_24310 [Puccinia coronata f. sp. avenae]PLW40191.1 hypothetical protein PCASD_12299 [Puccinia coronata f. sp. avenae]